MEWCMWWLQQQCGQQQRGQLFGVLVVVHSSPHGRCRARARNWAWLGSGQEVIWWSGPRRPAALAACDPSIKHHRVDRSRHHMHGSGRLAALSLRA